MMEFINNYLIILNFKKKIKRVFGNQVFDEKKQILLEFNAFQNFHICGSYLANYLKKKYKCKIFAFFNYSILTSELNFNFVSKIKWILGDLLSIKNFGIYKALGVEKIFRPKIQDQHYKLANMKYDLLKKKI